MCSRPPGAAYTAYASQVGSPSARVLTGGHRRLREADPPQQRAVEALREAQRGPVAGRRRLTGDTAPERRGSGASADSSLRRPVARSWMWTLPSAVTQLT